MRTLALLFVIASTTALADTAWEQRSATFRKNTSAERKRLGLDTEKARQGYPTPEVRFGASGVACPGETTTVLLEGKLLPGTLVGTASDAVEVVKEELTPKGWQATLKVKAGASGTVLFEVIAPVSGITSTVELRVGCAREWVLDVATGERLVLKVVDGVSRVPGEWFRGKSSLGQREFSLSANGTEFYLGQQDSAEERERKRQAQEAYSGDKAKAAALRQQALAKEMMACSKLPPAKMAPCMQQYAAELQEMNKTQQALVQSAQAAATPTVGCATLQGTIEGKKLSGQAQGCAGKEAYDQVPCTGVIK